MALNLALRWGQWGSCGTGQAHAASVGAAGCPRSSPCHTPIQKMDNWMFPIILALNWIESVVLTGQQVVHGLLAPLGEWVGASPEAVRCWEAPMMPQAATGLPQPVLTQARGRRSASCRLFKGLSVFLNSFAGVEIFLRPICRWSKAILNCPWAYVRNFSRSKCRSC